MHSDPLLHIEHDAVDVAGARRTFTVLGARATTGRRDVVLVFHGSKQTGDSHRRFTGNALAPLAVAGDAVVAYLDGHRGNWNDARRGSAFPARLDGADDVAFARAVVRRLTGTHGADPDRVVAVGYSNGGQMVLRLLHETPDLVAAAVVVAATMPAPEDFLSVDPAPAARPVPITLVHGTRDRIVPFAGGSMRRWAEAFFKVGGRTLSAPGTAAQLAARNGITAAPETDVLPRRPGSRGRTTTVRTVHAEEGRPPVTLYAVQRGGHTVPGPHRSPVVLGRTGGDIALVDLVRDALARIDGAPGPSAEGDGPGRTVPQSAADPVSAGASSSAASR